MKRVLRTAFVFTFVVGFSSAYVHKALWACGGICGEGNQSSHEAGEHAIQTKAEVKGEKAEAVKDPVCGMEVGDVKKAASEEYKGKVYYFCSENCKKTFKKDPASYVTQQGVGGEHKH